MQRGNLIIYDLEGKIIIQTGEAQGDVLPHNYPVGIPYMELPYGTMGTNRVIGIDVTVEPHQPIFEEITTEETPEQKIARLEAELEALKNSDTQ